jgi:hypothetical protein
MPATTQRLACECRGDEFIATLHASAVFRFYDDGDTLMLTSPDIGDIDTESFTCVDCQIEWRLKRNENGEGFCLERVAVSTPESEDDKSRGFSRAAQGP